MKQFGGGKGPIVGSFLIISLLCSAFYDESHEGLRRPRQNVGPGFRMTSELRETATGLSMRDGEVVFAG
uniref:Putative secreted protein n=1 Tax=Anopheles marajoara TaxID=58244 RepID=A0A2M4CEW4_9DIPT